MRELRHARIADALAAWGGHELVSRYGGSRDADTSAATEVALVARSPLIARLLAAGPVRCVLVELVPKDQAAIVIADGRTLECWADEVLSQASRSGEDVRDMVAGTATLTGPLVAAAINPDETGVITPPIMLLDGWHRGAAWLEQGRRGRLYPIVAYLILTERPVARLGRPMDGGHGITGTLGDYLHVQEHNLRNLSQLSQVQLIEQLSRIYDRTFAVISPDPQSVTFHCLVAAHDGLLSAAGAILRALPGDSFGLTRRAVEAARLAAAIKADSANQARWVAEEARLGRWRDRLHDPKPSALPPVQYPRTPNIERLGKMVGILSDAGTHFTPELSSMRPPRVEGGRLEISYFQSDVREVARALLSLASIHLQLLDVFDGCFDGALSRDDQWARQRAAFADLSVAMMEEFQGEALGPTDVVEDA